MYFRDEDSLLTIKRLITYEIYYTEHWIQDLDAFLHDNADLKCGYCIATNNPKNVIEIHILQEILDDLFEHALYTNVSDDRIIILVLGSRFNMNEEIEKCSVLYERIRLIFDPDVLKIGIGTSVIITEIKRSISESLEVLKDNNNSIIYYGDKLIDSDYNHSSVISSFIEYISSNFQNNISLYDVSKVLQLSPNYLSSIIKSCLGKSYIKYLMEFRIEKAKELLTSTSLTAKVVGEKVGYPDPIYFNRVFKSITGSTPLEFRHKFGE